jgi:hypothetical protein
MNVKIQLSVMITKYVEQYCLELLLFDGIVNNPSHAYLQCVSYVGKKRHLTVR